MKLMKSKSLNRLPALLALCAVVVITAGSCSDDKRDGAGGPSLAEVNGSVITPDDLRITIDLLYPPGKRLQYTSPQGRSEALQRMIVMEMFYQEGVAQGLDQDPRIKQIVENYKRFLIFNTLMTRGINGQAVNNFFQTNFVHVAMIFLEKGENSTAEDIEAVKEKAQKIHDEIKSADDFIRLAKEHSQHPSAKHGGNLGAITRSELWEPQMTEAAMALTPDQPLSTIVESPVGFYLVYLINPPGSLPADLLIPMISQNIYAHLLGQNYTTYAAQLQTQASVEVHPEVLENMQMGKPMGLDGGTLPALVPEGTPGEDTIYNP